MKETAELGNIIKEFKTFCCELCELAFGQEDWKKALTKQLNRGSIVIPIFFLCEMFISPTSVYIPEIHLTLWGTVTPLVLLIIIMLWVSVFPLRKYCCNGSLFESCYNIVPVLIYLIFVFAQYKFRLAVGILVFLCFTYIMAALLINYSYPNINSERDIYKRKKKKARFFVSSTAVLLLIPGLISVVVYEMQSPYVYIAEQDLPVTSSSEKSSLYETNLSTLMSFQEDNWNVLSSQERVELIQWLVNFESDKLGFDLVPVTVERLNILTLGDYDLGTNSIRIDIQEVESATAYECVEVISHECFHAFQQYLVNNIDWNSQVTQSSYFDTIRTWKENGENYISGYVDYDGYANQPVELSASNYSEEEVSTIFGYINGTAGETD